jgi:hypothetical protein
VQDFRNHFTPLCSSITSKIMWKQQCWKLMWVGIVFQGGSKLLHTKNIRGFILLDIAFHTVIWQKWTLKRISNFSFCLPGLLGFVEIQNEKIFWDPVGPFWNIQGKIRNCLFFLRFILVTWQCDFALHHMIEANVTRLVRLKSFSCTLGDIDKFLFFSDS